MEQNKLIRWVEANYPPIDLNENIKSIIDLVRQVKELTAENQRLKSIEPSSTALELINKVNRLELLERSFYMDICRAYNAGKENMSKCIQGVAENNNDGSDFKSSHDYFLTEFPTFKTNVP